MGKLIDTIPDIKFARLGFENVCRIARQASRCQHAFSKPCLVNLILKDTHLVFSIYVPCFLPFPITFTSATMLLISDNIAY